MDKTALNCQVLGKTNLTSTTRKFCTIHASSAPYTPVLHHTREFCTIHASSAPYTRVLPHTREFCTIHASSAPYTPVLHHTREFCPIHANSAPYTRVLHHTREFYTVETLIFWLVRESWPSTPQKRSDSVDTPVSGYKHKQQDHLTIVRLLLLARFNNNENIVK